MSSFHKWFNRRKTDKATRHNVLITRIRRIFSITMIRTQQSNHIARLTLECLLVFHWFLTMGNKYIIIPATLIKKSSAKSLLLPFLKCNFEKFVRKISPQFVTMQVKKIVIILRQMSRGGFHSSLFFPSYLNKW